MFLIWDDRLGGLDGMAKPSPMLPVSEDRGVDADDLAVHVDSGPPGAAVDRGVGLDSRRRTRLDVTARRHDAGRHGAASPNGLLTAIAN